MTDGPPSSPVNRPSSGLIGILAGMGPRSTAPFVDLVVTECQKQYGAKEDLDFPPMMIYSLPTPFYDDRPIDPPALKAAICEGLKKLESTGVDFIAMPCNSAHIYYEDLVSCIHAPLLNMIDEALRALPAGVTKMALLATRPTAESGLYQAGAKRFGVELLTDERWQILVDDLIRVIKSSQTRDGARMLWRELLAEVKSEGVESAVLACTDLNAVSGTAQASLSILDATECLARAAVRKWRTGA